MMARTRPLRLITVHFFISESRMPNGPILSWWQLVAPALAYARRAGGRRTLGRKLFTRKCELNIALRAAPNSKGRHRPLRWSCVSDVPAGSTNTSAGKPVASRTGTRFRPARVRWPNRRYGRLHVHDCSTTQTGSACLSGTAQASGFTAAHAGGDPAPVGMGHDAAGF